ncbi:hypothetical protein [Paraglaciecola chathamensis]|uniref:hypothetical protein n=1 Tax=Paraglaciecola chathamensis TaxID=368405 RepID=UPI003630C63F
MYKIECTLYGKNKEGKRDKAYFPEASLYFYKEDFNEALAVKKMYEKMQFDVKLYKAEGWFYIG